MSMLKKKSMVRGLEGWPVVLIFTCVSVDLGLQWRSSLRHCATNRQVAGSLPNGATGYFHWHNPFVRTTALGSTQPLTETSTRNLSWGVNTASVYG
jgi:hypothetical protein